MVSAVEIHSVVDENLSLYWEALESPIQEAPRRSGGGFDQVARLVVFAVAVLKKDQAPQSLRKQVLMIAVG